LAILFFHLRPLASLARELPDLPGYADRLELYVDGLELANGFGELTDPAEQRRRFESDLKNRTASGRAAVPLDKAFLDSLEEAMPPAAGMALGIERLLMWLSGTQDIREVLAFAWGER
jgi:lysyl-tRNA synthetase class 2